MIRPYDIKTKEYSYLTHWCKQDDFNTINSTLLPTGVHNLGRVVFHPRNHDPLCILRNVVISKCRPLCWLGDQLTIMPFTRKERNVGRTARDETSCSKVRLFDIPFGPYPWCGGHNGNATSLPSS